MIEGFMRKLTHEEIVHRQKTNLIERRLPFCVILNNIRSLYNVGSIFRTADGVGVEKIWLCGITGHPPSNMISKTALGAEKQVLWEYRKDTIPLIEELRNQKYQIVSLEQMAESVPYEEFSPKFPICLVMGNETQGVCDSVVSHCDRAIEINMVGLKNSLNVSVAFGVVAYHFRQCYKVSKR